MIDFGQQLRTLRSQFGMTQADLAQASSLGQSTISALETGRQGPWPSTRRALARAFNLSLEEFDLRTGLIAESGFEPGMEGAAESERSSEGADPARRPSNWGTGTAEQPPSPRADHPQPWPFGQPAAAPPSAAAGEFRYAPAKVMELLNQLGQVEHQLNQYRVFVREVCAACWTTDATLHITGAFGPHAAEQRQRHGEVLGKHVGEFFESAWGEISADFLPLAMHQKAVDGNSVGFQWEIDGTRYLVFIDPIRDSAGKISGTVGLAIDVTFRELHPNFPRP
jgi:transcriptional regulator with XRE-family HTH domain